MNCFRAFRILAGGLALCIGLVGCGGSGSNPGTPMPNSALKQAVRTSIENGFRAEMAGATSGVRAGTALTRDGQAPFFDEELGLWAKPVGADYEYFVDEALTEAAGTAVQTILDGGLLSRTVTTITAGKYAGLTATLESGLVGGLPSIRYTGQSPLTGPFSFFVVVVDGTVELESAYRDEDGVDRLYKLRLLADGTQRVEYNTAKDFRYILNYAADGSGSGTVTGVSSLLPATLSWDTAGTGKLVFADETEFPFEKFDFSF